MYKRTPEAVRAAKPDLQAAFALLQRVWVKDYQHIWTALQVGAPIGACPAHQPWRRPFNLCAPSTAFPGCEAAAAARS
jgi:hypothetical protein